MLLYDCMTIFMLALVFEEHELDLPVTAISGYV